MPNSAGHPFCMRSRSRIAFVLLGSLWVVANVAWLGCAVVPLPSSRHPIDSRRTGDFKFVKKSQPTRDEVVAKLGSPDAYLPDARVACYRINSVTHRKFLILFLIPAGVEKYDDFDLALIEFDDTDRVKRYGLVRQASYESYERAASLWLGNEDPVYKSRKP